MAGWRDFAVRREPEPVCRANSADRANSPPNGTIGTSGTVSHSKAAAALARLEGLACPSSCDPSAWGRMVADARSLVLGGWASKAMDLGWSEVDLFGIAKGQDGCPGLAAWLRGDELAALSHTWAAVRLPHAGRRYFNRPVGAVLPWGETDDDGA